jgi:hypothetical protein
MQKLILKINAVEKKYRRLFFYTPLLTLLITSYLLRKEVVELHAKVAQLEERNLFLVSNMIIFNRNYEEFPLPVWQKVKRGNQFIMQYINPAYVDAFGHQFGFNQYNLIGKTNFDIFPQKFAQQYYENDVAVAVTGLPLELTEYSKDTTNGILHLEVLKWRDIKDNKDTLVYGLVKKIYKVKQ